MQTVSLSINPSLERSESLQEVKTASLADKQSCLYKEDEVVNCMRLP